MTLDYVATRIGQLLLIVFIAVTANFLIPRLIPGDPIENALQTRMQMTGSVDINIQEVAALYRAKFGLDKPLWLQYLNYWRDIFRFDLGVSLIDFPQPVISKVRSALPWTAWSRTRKLVGYPRTLSGPPTANCSRASRGTSESCTSRRVWSSIRVPGCR